MSFQRIINIFMVVATLLSTTMLMMSFSSLYQAENLGQGISIRTGAKSPTTPRTVNINPHIISKNERIWNGSKVIEIIEPATERMEE